MTTAIMTNSGAAKRGDDCAYPLS